MKKFTKKIIVNFYIELLKNRMVLNRGSHGFYSAQTTLLLLLQSIIIEASPVLMYTCQEVFQHMPDYLFAEKKPLTIFQLNWPGKELYSEDMVQILSNFQLRDQFEVLFNLREQMKPDLESISKMIMQEGRFDFDLVFITKEPDSDLSTLLESTLGSEASEFFFGCNVDVKMNDKDLFERQKSDLP